jgi:hypothetical protein
MKIEKLIPDSITDKSEDHFSSNPKTPLRSDAFDKTDDEKIKIIEKKVLKILETLGMDMTDDSLKGTPLRVAKMFVKETFGGLHPDHKPKASIFKNSYKYGEMLVEKNITLYSDLRTSSSSDCRKSSLSLYFKWVCDRIIKNESYRRLLCKKTSSSRAPYITNCERTSKMY